MVVPHSKDLVEGLERFQGKEMELEKLRLGKKEDPEGISPSGIPCHVGSGSAPREGGMG